MNVTEQSQCALQGEWCVQEQLRNSCTHKLKMNLIVLMAEKVCYLFLALLFHCAAHAILPSLIHILANSNAYNFVDTDILGWIWKANRQALNTQATEKI